MAEKEEKLSIEVLKDDFCASCDNRGKLKNCCCYEKQEYDDRYQKSLSRQEVINCMADAISDAAKRSCDKKFVAEAALNALLEK